MFLNKLKGFVERTRNIINLFKNIVAETDRHIINLIVDSQTYHQSMRNITNIQQHIQQGKNVGLRCQIRMGWEYNYLRS